MSFDNVVGGKLNLKGGSLPVVGGIKKKKKKSKPNELVLQLALQMRMSGRGGFRLLITLRSSERWMRS